MLIINVINVTAKATYSCPISVHIFLLLKHFLTFHALLSEVLWNCFLCSHMVIYFFIQLSDLLFFQLIPLFHFQAFYNYFFSVSSSGFFRIAFRFQAQPDIVIILCLKTKPIILYHIKFCTKLKIKLNILSSNLTLPPLSKASQFSLCIIPPDSNIQLQGWLAWEATSDLLNLVCCSVGSSPGCAKHIQIPQQSSRKYTCPAVTLFFRI